MLYTRGVKVKNQKSKNRTNFKPDVSSPFTHLSDRYQAFVQKNNWRSTFQSVTGEKDIWFLAFAPDQHITPALALSEHQNLFDYWKSLDCISDLPASNRINPAQLRAAMATTLMLEPNANFSDFRYRRFGPKIGAVNHVDLENSWLSERPAPLSDIFCEQYQYTATNRTVLYSEHNERESESAQTRWCRLILPIVDVNDQVHRILVSNVEVAQQNLI